MKKVYPFAPPRSSRGYSLLELLICVAIISILMAMYASTLSKALAKAKQVAATEGMRQQGIGRMADSANSVRPDQRQSVDALLRAECRAAYRQWVDLGQSQTYATEMLFVVRNEAEFRAYWHTLINPENDAELERSGNGIVARDESGEEYVLLPQDTFIGETYPVGWEFLSTNLGDTGLNGLGLNVLYSDGRVAYLTYPGGFPACRAVAELSQQFVDNS